MSGRRPFDGPVSDGNGADDDSYPQLRHEPAPLGKKVPDALGGPILRCLAKDPDARPTAAELHDALEPLMAALPRRPVLSRLKPKLR